jgi:hypothetical protein
MGQTASDHCINVQHSKHQQSTRNKALFLVTPQAPSNREQLLYFLLVLCVPLSTKIKTTKLDGSPTVDGWTRNCPTGTFTLQFQRYVLDLTFSNKDFEETVWTRVDG